MNKKLWRGRWVQGPVYKGTIGDCPINATQALRLRPARGQCPEELLWTPSWASSCPPVSAVLHHHYHHPHCCRCWNFSSCLRGLMNRCKDKDKTRVNAQIWKQNTRGRQARYTGESGVRCVSRVTPFNFIFSSHYFNLSCHTIYQKS